MLEVQGDGVVITTIKPTRDGQELLVRLFNTADHTVDANLIWTHRPESTWISNPMEDQLESSDGSVTMVKHEIVTVQVSF